jgi:hypothetical protein
MFADNRKTLALLAALLFASFASRAQSVSALAAEVGELAAHLAAYSDVGDDQVLLAQYGLIAVSKDVAGDKVKELAAEIASQGKAMNLPGHLNAIYQDGEKAKQAVNAVNTNLPDAPDFSHLEYCAQAQASSDQIARIESTIKDLQKLVGQAQSYKMLLVPLDQMKDVLGNIFGHLVGLDILTEETTYGTMAQQWEFLTAPAGAGGPGDGNANFLISNSKADWDVVEKQAGDKAQKLKGTLEARKAFHEHFYSIAAQKCSDDSARAAALASFGGESNSVAPGSGSPFPGVGAVHDQCQVAQQQVGAFLSSCMQPQASACGTFRITASCYSRAASQCGACGTCSSQFQSAAAQARASAQQVCAN